MAGGPASRTRASTTLRHDAATRFWKEYKDVALLQQFLGGRDIKSAMRYVNIDGKEASRLMRSAEDGLCARAHRVKPHRLLPAAHGVRCHEFNAAVQRLRLIIHAFPDAVGQQEVAR
jgi:hypothetical protein